MPGSKEKLRVLVVGSGGREHALAWKLEQSDRVEVVYIAPGNGGTANGAKCQNVNIQAADFPKLLDFAKQNGINLVVPGPDQQLVDGIEQVFRKAGIPCFGPTPEAARLEGSKAYAKDFMARHAIPTAKYATFTSYDEAKAYVKAADHRVVLKASGLALGKGVLIPENKEEALAGLKEIMLDKAFGDAGDEVVIEEFLEGQELSILAFCDGYTVLPLPGAQDHKRANEGDTGPNTGGMGTYSPAPVATQELQQRIVKEALEPTLAGMRKEGFPFVGMLFTGFMIDASGKFDVLEYNVRFGDPETQSLLALMATDCDLAEIMLACIERRLDCATLSMKDEAAVTVVLASGGYPGSYKKGVPISLPSSPPKDVLYFHAGTAEKDGQLVTAGGRVLGVTATAKTLKEAVDLAYKGVEAVSWDGMMYRKDIAHRAFKAASAGQAQSTAGLTYAQAGVSIDAGNELVEEIKAVVKSTARPGSDSVIGGFGGLFDLKAAGFVDPILVSGTDGVGTKLKVAQATGIHGTIGIDLVAMSVNDLVVQGAEPLFFLDYYACSTLDVNTAAAVVKGVAEGCRQSNCALVGGETAEMPGLYNGDEYDAAGFAVGAVEREALLPRPDIKAGDVLIGIASSGVHSNGFSLVRKVIEHAGLTYSSPCPWESSVTIGQNILTPTRIYIRQLLPSIKAGLLKGLSHITGGGFTENIPRMLPKTVGVEIDLGQLTMPDTFRWLMRAGQIAPMEMLRTFNCGIGMVCAVAPEHVDEAIRTLQQHGEAEVVVMGAITDTPGVQYKNMDKWAQQSAL